MAVVVGVDVATRLGRVGVARGRRIDGCVMVDAVEAGGRGSLPGAKTGPTAQMVRTVAAWVTDALPAAPAPAILALDAPLGWPAPLLAGLAGHRPGVRLPAPEAPDRLWRRATDVHVHETIGKLPLEVGADRIARAAWAGLEILHAVRATTGEPWPVPVEPGSRCALEVYPAATLRRLLGRAPGRYKGTATEARAALLDALADHVTVAPHAREVALAVDHAFDAVMCVIAGAWAAAGHTEPVPPGLREMAAVEGWIHLPRAPG